MTDSIQITTGDATTGLHVKNVEGDNTEITGTKNIIDVPLLKRLMAEEGLDNPQIADNLQQLEKSNLEPERFQQTLDFFIGVAKGVTIKWISKMILG